MELLSNWSNWIEARHANASLLSSNLTGANATLTTDGSNPIAAWWMLLIFVLMTAVTVFGNLAIVTLFLADKKVRTPFNYILLNIAIGDALIGTVDMPYYAASYFYWGFWPFSDQQCSFWMFIDYLMPTITLASITALSLDRLWALMAPIAYRCCNTTRKASVTIFVIWLYSTLGMLPGYAYTRLYLADQRADKTCLWEVAGLPNWASPSYPLIINLCAPFAITLLCYVGIVLRLLQLRSSRAAVNPETHRQTSKRNRREQQAFAVLTLLVVTLSVSYMPWVVYTVRLVVLKYEDSLTFYNVSYWMGFILSAASPFMALVGSQDLRTAMRRLCHGRSGNLENPSGNRVSVLRKATAPIPTT
ncbi:hypothetical protein RvY_04095 [Ramazzottius varieornatus]|uniref:G-protein coupled receptors family 1 profile domain-containing protein n=1 Tax=Ramazzottius varieornatus TaxID=947166 RepID=A0A1D1V0G6_RAMVA|nr:hypothetical protein RvY_04095 [Ramazzottius varieornatus]